MVQYIVESQIVFLLLLLFYRVVLHNRVNFGQNRWFLYLILPLCFLIPLLEIPVYATNVIQVIVSSSGSVTQTVLESGKEPSIPLLLFFYFCGAGIFLSVFLFNITRVLLLMRRSEMVPQSGCRIFFIEKGSCGFSFFRNIFVNGNRLKVSDLDTIIRHEMIHIKRNHSVDLVVGEILKILFWWNPAVWYWQRVLREVHEFQVDESMLKESMSKTHYINLMIEQITDKYPEFVCGFSISSKNNSLTKKRLIMITKQNRRGVSKYRILLSIPMLTALVAMFGFTAKASTEQTTIYQATYTSSQDATQKPREEKTAFPANFVSDTLKAVTIDLGNTGKLQFSIVGNGEQKGLIMMKAGSKNKKIEMDLRASDTIDSDEWYINSKKVNESEVRELDPETIKSMEVRVNPENGKKRINVTLK